MTGSAHFIRGDANRLPLASESVDLIITSPPYFALRSYRDGGEHYGGQIGSEPTPQAFLEALWSVTQECWRVLKPTGSMFVNLGDKRSGSGGHNNNGLGKSTLGHHKGGGGPHAERMKATRRNAPDRYIQAAFGRAKSKMLLPHRYAIGCEDGLADPEGIGWIVRQDIVWSKPNGLPESVTDRTRDSHEYWFHLTKQGRYFSAVDEVREAYTPGTESRYVSGFGVTKRAQNGASHNAMDRSMAAGDGGPTAQNPLGKLPGSVWTIPSEPLRIPDDVRERENLTDHFAAFPHEWPRRLILGWSPAGVCVACGEGRRPVVSKKLSQTSHTGQRNGSGRRDRREWDSNSRGINGNEVPIGNTIATITGYACACADTTADTTPGVVLDPFAGTGTTVGMARQLGRIGIGVDLSADYLRLARWRTFESGHAAKAIERARKKGWPGAGTAPEPKARRVVQEAPSKAEWEALTFFEA